MKKMLKFIFLLAVLVIVSSCNNDNFDDMNSNDQIQLRSALNTLADDPISQITGIPLHLKMTSGVNHQSNFLSARKSSRIPCLYNQDDNSGRQKWYLLKTGSGYMIKAEKGVKNGWLHLGLKAEETQGTWPRMQSYYTASNMLWTIEYVPSADRYTMAIQCKAINNKAYLSAKSATDTGDLTMSNIDNSGRQYWEIHPIEDFELIDIKYDQLVTDKFTVQPKTIASKIISNNYSTPISRTISFSESVSNSSGFSETKGLSVTTQVSSSFKVGIPLFADGKINVDITTQKDWKYTTTSQETQTVTISESFTQEIKPYDTVTAKLILNEYKANLTYIATLRGVSSRRIIYLKGKWNGIVVKESKVDVYNTNNQLLRTIK